MKLSEHFNLEELTANHHGLENVPNAGEIENLKAWCFAIGEPLRAYYDVPVIVSSGFRSKELNKQVGGAPTSQHTKGEAVDFQVRGVPNAAVWKFIVKELVFDQVIAELLSRVNGRAGWIHCSYSRLRPNRKDALSFNGKVYVKGLQFID